MTRRPFILLLTIAALCLALAASASAATTPHAGSTRSHHVIRAHRHHRRHTLVHRAGVTRAAVHRDPIAVTALGLHHTGDPIAFAATAR